MTAILGYIAIGLAVVLGACWVVEAYWAAMRHVYEDDEEVNQKW